MMADGMTVALDGLEIAAAPAGEHRDGQAAVDPLARPVPLDGSLPDDASDREPLEPKLEVSSRGDLPLQALAGPLGHGSDESPEQATEDPPRVGRNLGALAGGQAVTFTMTALWTLFVPRALGPVGLGLVVSAQSVSGILTIVLGVGARNYLVREIVVERDRAAELVRTAIVLRLTLAPIVGLAAVVWTHVAHYGHEASVVLYLITAMAILTLVAEPMQAAFQATERMKYLAYGDMVNKTQQSLIGIALVLIGFGAIGIAVNMAAAAAVVFLLYAFWLRRFVHMDAKTNVRKMGTMAKQSSAYWVTWFFGFFYFWIDTIMLTLMTRPEVVGWYGATTSLFITLSFLPSLVGTAWLPRLVASFAQGHRNLVKTSRTPLEFILVVSIPVAAGMAMAARPLIETVYGPAFGPAVPVMIILACCIPSGYLNIILVQVLIAAKRQAIWSFVMVAAAVINPLMNLALIPATENRYHDGAIGAAVSLLLTEALMTVVAFIFVGRHVFDRRAMRRFVLATAASLGMLGVAYAAHPLGAAAAVAAGCGTLVLLTVALRIATPDEIALVRAGIARARAGRRNGSSEERQTQAPTVSKEYG